MSEMQDIPRDKYPNLSSYISKRTGAHPSVNDAVALVLLNQFISISAGFDLGDVSYTRPRPQRVFCREQLDEFMKSMRVLELTFTDGYPDWGSNGGRIGSFRAKTVVPPLLHRNPIGPPSSYPDLYGQAVKVPSQGFDISFLAYKKGFVPDRDSLEDELATPLATGKYGDKLGTLSDALYHSCLSLPKPKADALFDLIEAADENAIASEQFFVLATRFEEESADIKIAPDIVATIRKLAELFAKIESEVDSMLDRFPVDPKGLIETIAKHAVGSRGALIVSGDACDSPPDTFRTVRTFQNVVLYQKID